MNRNVDELRQRYFGDDTHPYRILENAIRDRLAPDITILDAGCGRTAPVLSKWAGENRTLIGVDQVEFSTASAGLRLYNGDIGNMPIPDGSVDLVYSRSVMEHVANPDAAYAEINRVLKPGGQYIFLTPNFFDYASLIAAIIPNRFHPRIVRMAEGRAEQDVFPTHYKTNTKVAVTCYANRHGFTIRDFRYLGQYPAYFSFSPFLFRVATFYELLLRRFRPLWPLLGWIFVVLEKAGPPASSERQGGNDPVKPR